MSSSLFDEPKFDSHCHVLDPARVPYAPDVAYRPAGQEMGTLAQYLEVMDAYGIRQSLLVGLNSGYGLDNRCLLEALQQHPGRFRGIAVVRNDIPRDKLLRLREAGVVGAWPSMRRCSAPTSTPTPTRCCATSPTWTCSSRCRPSTTNSSRCGRCWSATARASSSTTAVGQRGVAGSTNPVSRRCLRWRAPGALLDALTLDACFWASDWPFLKAPHRLEWGR